MPLRDVLLVEFPEALLPPLVHNNVDPGDGLADDLQIPCAYYTLVFFFIFSQIPTHFI